MHDTVVVDVDTLGRLPVDYSSTARADAQVEAAFMHYNDGITTENNISPSLRTDLPSHLSTDPARLHPNVGYTSDTASAINNSNEHQDVPGPLPSSQDLQFDSRFANPVTAFSSGLTDECDFLWDYSSNSREFLPTTFFDTNYSLSDLWQIDKSRVENSYATPQDSNSYQVQIRQPLNTSRGNSFRPLTALEAAIHHPNVERLPVNDLNDSRGLDTEHASAPGPAPWNMSVSVYQIINHSILVHERILPTNFAVPSKHTFSRYIEGYFRNFHKHLPFLHPPTLRLESLAPELVLALAAVGALYRFEHTRGYELYFAAKAIVTEQFQHQFRSSTAHLTSSSPSYAGFTPFCSHESALSTAGSTSSAHPPAKANDQAELHTIQTLIILMAMSSWADAPIVRDSLSISSQLAMLLREAGISTSDEIAEGSEWSDWITREVRRRTLFVAYILFNLQSIAFNVPPQVLNQDIRLCLPHCGSEWAATTAAEWSELRRMYGHNEYGFQEVFQRLLDGHEIHTQVPLSALGNYVLMSGILQRIFLERHTSGCLLDKSCSLRPSIVISFECALQAWQKSWEATQESSLDPSSSKGPLGFNAVAMLRLAYIRLNANLGPYRSLISRDPQHIAGAFTDESIPLFVRSLHLDRAVLQCVHALSVPVYSGIASVAHTQALNWSIQVALSNLECAFLLSRWLYVIAGVVQATGIASLRGDERKLLGMITTLIKETALAKNLERGADDAQRIRWMGATIVRLWGETFKGVHVFNIVVAVGASLQAAAEILEARL